MKLVIQCTARPTKMYPVHINSFDRWVLKVFEISTYLAFYLNLRARVSLIIIE
jgi:hypothetical protein